MKSKPATSQSNELTKNIETGCKLCINIQEELQII